LLSSAAVLKVEKCDTWLIRHYVFGAGGAVTTA
jgi:hypothetical protein